MIDTRPVSTPGDVNAARMVLADYEDTMPVDLVVDGAARAAVGREFNHVLAAGRDATGDEVRQMLRDRLTVLGIDVRPAKYVQVAR